MSMWKREEVQKVLRCSSLILLLAALLLAEAASAAVLPEEFGGYKKVAKGVVDIADRQVWDEYGFQTAERADYGAAGARVSVSVWQLKDTTGALAAAQWLQPGVVQHGNYVIRTDGNLPGGWPESPEIETSQCRPGSESKPPAVPAGQGSPQGVGTLHPGPRLVGQIRATQYLPFSLVLIRGPRRNWLGTKRSREKCRCCCSLTRPRR